MAIVTTHVAAVQQMYVAYFGRPADTAGLDYWTNVVEANAGATAAVSAAFAASPEYIVTYFGQSNTQIVNNIYQNLFGRDADAAGSAYWANLLTNGTIKVDTIVAEVAKAALTTDKEAVENKVAASTAFTAALDTPAEVAGYQGNSALTLAKAFVKGVTSDATLTAAVAPTALNATVAAVVKAGTPFSLETAVAASTAANEALVDFLDENDLTDTTAAADLEDGVDDAALAVQTGGVAGFATATSPAVRAALLAEVEANLEETASDRQEDLAEARAAAGTRVLAIADNLAAAIVADEEATAAAAEAVLVRNAAEATVEARAEGRAVTITEVDGAVTAVTIAPVAPAVDPIPLVRVTTSGTVVLATGVTEAKYPGVTALVTAINANTDAQVDAETAAEALATVQDEFAALTPTQQGLANDVEAATVAADNADEAITDLADLVADYEEAVALETEYDALAGAVTAASANFTSNGYVAPKFLDVATAAATSGSDLFLLGEETEVTISSFGRSGNDTIFVGSDFVLNTGDLEDGNNAALEVFFVQNGTRAEVHVENAVYGSESGSVTVITLVGVDATDLQFNNGVITLVDPAN